MAILALLMSVPPFADALTLHALPSRTPDDYAKAGRRVTIAPGRSLNLRCLGDGPRTVLLEAGGNADSTSWFRVQALLSPSIRTCAYDRAGYGFSDEGPLPRNLDADVSDLSALVEAAPLKTPLILVGHSLGSNIVRRYAQRHPRYVAALVLVDPPVQGAAASLPENWKREEAASLVQRNALLDRCAEAAEAGAMDDAQHMLAACLRTAPAWQSDAVAAAVRTYKLAPAYWRTLRSELDANVAIFAAPVPPDETYGEIPVVVLTADLDVTGMPDDVSRVMHEARAQTHARLVASSRTGYRIGIPHASHDLQLDAPQAVAETIRSLLSARPPIKE